ILFFTIRRLHTRFSRDWSSDVCSSDLSVCHLLCAPLRTAAARLYDSDNSWYSDQSWIAHPPSTSTHRPAATSSAARVSVSSPARSEERRGGKDSRYR